MLAAVFALVVHATPIERPVLPVGCSPVVSQLAGRIATLTQKGDFEGAKAAAKLLPHRLVKVQWDDSAVPAGARFDFARVRDQVFVDWRRFASLASYEMVTAGADVRVVFQPGSGLKLNWSDDANGPRLTASIGLNEEKAGPVDPATVNNEFSFAIGSYLGVAKLPLPGLVMAGATISPPAAIRPNTVEASIANQTVMVCEQIRQLAEKNQVMQGGVPIVAETPAPVEWGKVFQGDVPKMAFTIKNSGGGRLAFKIIPDCSCFATTALKVANSGESVQVEAQMDTQQFWGTVHKTLYLFSNDAEQPVREIPVSISITPRYRILPPAQTYVAGDDGLLVEAYFFVPAERPLKIRGAESQGLPAEVKFEKWEGSLADPDMGEEARARQGYKLLIRLKDVPEGSTFGTNIVITTDDDEFPAINYPLYVQKGIVVGPSSVYFGEVGASVRKTAITVSRPGKPFHILGIDSDSAHISATFEPAMVGDKAKVGEYRITVAFDGKASVGDYRASLTIRTDDPKQPKIVVPVSAMVHK